MVSNDVAKTKNRAIRWYVDQRIPVAKQKENYSYFQEENNSSSSASTDKKSTTRVLVPRPNKSNIPLAGSFHILTP